MFLRPSPRTRRERVRAVPCLALVLPILITACAPDERTPQEDLMTRAREIHDRVLTLDTHVDIPSTYATEEVDPGLEDSGLQVDLPGMRVGGLDAVFHIVYVGQDERTPEHYEEAEADARHKFEAIHRMAEEMYPDEIKIAYSADDVVRINESGKLVSAIGMENGFIIGRDLSLLETYYDLGGRYLTLAHNGHNDICDSANPREDLGDEEAEHGGVSEFGGSVIEEMNRLGIMIDVSHISRDAMLDAVRLSRTPVIASHSSARALADVPRNLDDEQLLAMAEKGGVAQMVAVGSFVEEDSPEKVQAQEELWAEYGVESWGDVRNLSEEEQDEMRRRWRELEERFPVTVQDFVDHIDHAVELVGIDHVGISSDFDGGGGIEGWDDASETPNVTAELVKRGYSEEEIAKLWSGNLLRVWREVERVAAEMQGM